MTAGIVAPEQLQTMIAKKEAGEATGEVAAILAAFIPEPLFEFFPVGRRIVGYENVTAFYAQMLSNFFPRVAGFRALKTYWNDSGMAMEEEITLHGLDGAPDEVHQFVVTTGVQDGHLWGERLYGSEAFFRLLLGECFETAERI